MPVSYFSEILQVSKVLEECFDIESAIEFEWSELKVNGRNVAFFNKMVFRFLIP
jgi:hypothetical protein